MGDHHHRHRCHRGGVESLDERTRKLGNEPSAENRPRPVVKPDWFLGDTI